MKGAGMVEETVKPTKFGNVVYCYKITETGTNFLESAKHGGALSKQDIQAIDEVYEQYGEMSYGALLDFVHKTYPIYHLKDVTL